RWRALPLRNRAILSAPCKASAPGTLVRIGMRWLLLLAAIGCFATPSGAQTSGERVYRLGILAPSLSGPEELRSIILPELARLGFSEGRNLVVVSRRGEETSMPRLVDEVLAAKVDALIAIGPGALISASRATRTVPIIGFGSDPTK